MHNERYKSTDLITGSAILLYTNELATVEVDSWHRSGQVKLIYSGGTIDENPSMETMLQQCLYPGIANTGNAKSIHKSEGFSGSSEDGTTAFCKLPVGAKGSWLGTYVYKGYLPKSVPNEDGHYGQQSLSFPAQSGRGFMGHWHATTGKYIPFSFSFFLLLI